MPGSRWLLDTNALVALASAAAQAATLLTNDAQLLKLHGAEPHVRVQGFAPAGR